MSSTTPPVPPAAIRGNDWRRLDPPTPEAFRPTIPITVVIPYYDAPEALDLTLAALERQTYPRHLFEVLIVDDGSPTPLRAPVSGPLDIRMFRQEDKGFGAARARNLGARMADHPILVFLDCDMLPEAGWLTAHARWHHTASDLLTLGFRAHVPVEGVHPSNIRDHRGTLDALWKGSPVDRPGWIEFHMARTADLTSDADDIFRVVTSGNLGVSRSFFELIGGFDESFDRWGMEDTEFGYRGYTLGGPLVPVREAFCWHQGGSASPDASKRKSLGLQRARVSHLIAHPDFRVAAAGRSYTRPRFVVSVDPTDRHPEAILATVEDVLANTVHDLVVYVGIDPGHAGYEWLHDALEPDPRVSLGRPKGAPERFSHSPFHITLPAGIACEPEMVERLHERLGRAAVGTGRLEDGSSISVTRAWAIHRSQRTGERIRDQGDEIKVETRGLASIRDDRGACSPGPLRRFCGKAKRVLSEMSRVRSRRQARAFARWILVTVRFRLAARLRPGRSLRYPTRTPVSTDSIDRPGRTPDREGKDRTPDHERGVRADYPLGLEIAVLGPRARAVFAASSQVHTHTDRASSGVVLSDEASALPPAGLVEGTPLVQLSEAPPRLAVPAFDPERVNPIGWVRNASGRTGALGPAGLLPPDIKIDEVVRPTDSDKLSDLHHIEDTAEFHSDTLRRAATLASMAATGMVVHVVDRDPELKAHLSAELYGAMRDEKIPGADAALRESLSIRMRRAALREHSLRARARQLAHEAGIANDVGLPGVSVILPTKRPSLLPNSLETVASQTYPNLELILALHGNGFPDKVDTSRFPLPIRVVRGPSEMVFGELLNRATAAAAGELITKMDDDDHYGREHVWDLVLAREFSGAELVAKVAEFVHLVGSGVTIHRDVGGGERLSRNYTVAGGAMMVARHDLWEAGGWRPVSTAVDQGLVVDLTQCGGRLYRTHGHGYVLVRHGRGHTWDAPDSYFLRQAKDRRPGCDLTFAGID